MIVNGEQYTMILCDYEQKEEKVEFSSKHSSDIKELS